MTLTVKNIGKLTDATIELNGITVIAGENNSGKSTMGKVLFSVVNGLYEVNNQINEERVRNTAKLIDSLIPQFTQMPRLDGWSNSIASTIINNHDLSNSENIATHIKNSLLGLSPERNIDDNVVKSCAERVLEVQSIPDTSIRARIVYKKLMSEFSHQLTNMHKQQDPASIILNYKQRDIKIQINDNALCSDIAVSRSILSCVLTNKLCH